MTNFWKKIFYRDTDIKKEKARHEKKDWKNPQYLQGVVVSLLNQIETLQNENKELRNKEGKWLSPKEIEEFNQHLKEFIITL